MKRIHHLAPDIELQLARGRIADAHGTGTLITGKPRHLPFDEPLFAGKSIHDVQVFRRSGDCAIKPFAPFFRFIVIAGAHQRYQGQRRVTNPAEAVVPIALAAQVLRQRSRRGGGDAACLNKGERLKRQQRPNDGFAPMAAIGAALRPFAPKPERLGQGGIGINRRGKRVIRKAHR